LSFWQSANNKTKEMLPPDDMQLVIQEKSLTNNMGIDEMNARKIQWKTMDQND